MGKFKNLLTGLMCVVFVMMSSHTLGGMAVSQSKFDVLPPDSMSVFTTQVPTDSVGMDGSAIEVGMKFRSSSAGYITGIRFYKESGNTGLHIGELYSKSGVRLAQATFTSETASGWQTVHFDTALAISADTTYVAAYYSDDGNYTATNNFFNSALVNGPLTGLGDGTDGHNGLYEYTANSPVFPTSTYSASNYWVDVLFSYTIPLVANAGANQTVILPVSSITLDGRGSTGSITTYSWTKISGPNTPVIADSTLETTTITGLVKGLYTFSLTLNGGASTSSVSINVLDTVSIFGSQLPTDPVGNDGSAIEVGMKFKSSQSGDITGIRFYKLSGNTGVHIGELYSRSGTRLGQATFSGESSTGWQTVEFSTPVHILADTIYVAAYYSDDGYYTATDGFFNNDLANGPLRALADGEDGPNGLYKYTIDSPVFPDATYAAGNYWVDVLFTTPEAPITQNYVMVNTVKQPGVTTEASVNGLAFDPQGKDQTIEYLDGLGRPIQTINVQASGNSQKDIVTGHEYDPYGREVKRYLPYADLGSSLSGSYRDRWQADQATFYTGTANNIDPDDAPYSLSLLEASPLNRVITQGAPGTVWQPNTAYPYDLSANAAQFQYLNNKSEDNVRIFSVDDAGNITSSGYYPAGQLIENVTSDENHQTTKQFTDKNGLVIVKRVITATDSLQTYYLYDDLNMLRAVIQPEGTAILQAASWAFPTGFSDTWMFSYRYDQRQRMVMKKVPGADSVNMIYDQWDRVVLTQDGNLRAGHNFLFTKYDQMNRPAVTGQMTDSRAFSSVVTDVAAATGRYETTNISATEGYNLNGSFPSSGSYTLTVYTTTLYDNYALPSWASGYGFVSEYSVSSQNNFTVGEVVATQSRILGTSNFNRTVMYYDDKYRPDQTISDNAAGGKDRITTVFTFDGKKTSDYHNHTSRFFTTPLLTQQVYTYDNAGGLLTTTHQTGTQEVVTIVDDKYNELGQLLNKKIHESTTHPTALQKLDYYYNIRGWLAGINRPLTGETGYEESDLFNMELHYNQGFSRPESTPAYNGNISEQVWKGGYDEHDRCYVYSYDNANRLLRASYAYQGSSGWAGTATYDESGISYDRNGNIKTLNRYHNGFGQIDNLSYANYNGNQLGRVDDAASPAPVGFQDATDGSGYDYHYDVNGNMTGDYNKAISSITYNFLNLPNVVTITGKGTITYTYDAAGNKLQKTTYETIPNKTTNYYYAGDYVYRNDTLEFISHPEGRLRPVRIDTTQPISIANLKYIYDYYLKDHLGSVRDVLTTEQQTDLYAATMETAAATKEDALFNNVSSTASPVISGMTNDASNKMASKLNGEVDISPNKRVGPSIVLKVMTGDTISISTLGWYQGPVQAPPSPTIVGDIFDELSPLLTGGVGASGGTHGGAIPGTISSPLLTADLRNFLDNRSYDNTHPKAFLNWMVVDEEFAGVSSANHTGATQMPVCNPGDTAKPLYGPANLVIRRNGWIYIYLSNESAQDVFFDNLVVNLRHGPLVELNDYYPFGLQISGLSTKALKANYYENRRKFNDGSELQNHEFLDGSGIESYDFNARTYDPQIGRFLQSDPLGEDNEEWSLYSYARNNPVLLNDPTGLDADTSGMLVPVIVVGVIPAQPAPPLSVNVGPAPATSAIAVGATVGATEAAGAGTITVTGLASIPLVGAFAVVGWAMYEVSHTPHPPPAMIIPGDIGIGVPKPYINQDIIGKVRPTINLTVQPPPYPLNPTLPPAPGWVWKGRPGSIPGSKQGSWVNPNTKESLWNDTDHGDPIGEHYDYKDPNGQEYRYYPDGRLEPKE